MPITLLRLIGLRNGPANENDGRYVVEYDPVVRDGYVLLRTTDDPGLARPFASLVEASEYWRQSHGTRPDGQPNRPLTAFTVSMEYAPDKCEREGPAHALSLYVIFRSPKDALVPFVVREQWVTKEGVRNAKHSVPAMTLEEARAAIPEGLLRSLPLPGDAATIVEVWF